MKKLILLSVLFVCVKAFSQAPDTTRPLQRLFTYVEYQNILAANGGLRIPKDTLKFKSGDTGYIAYKNGFFVWNGKNWAPISGSGGDVSGKLNISDTSSMLLAYKNGLLTRLRIQDTAAMLNGYQSLLAIKVKYSDTASMLANYQSGLNNRATVTQLNNAEALDVKYTDTSNMLTNYKNGLNLRLKYTDTAAMFAAHPVSGFDTTGKFGAYQSAINLRLKISDTAAMFAAHPSSGSAFDTTGKFTAYQTAINARVKYSDTSTILTPYQAAINARVLSTVAVKYTDTSGMLGAYAAALNNRVRYSDTANQLSAYRTALLARVLYTDTSTILSAYRTALLSRVRYTDTSGMLTPYQNGLNAKQNTITLTTAGTSGAATFNSSTGALNIPNYATGGGGSTDTTSLSSRINLKLNISDTASMLTSYQTGLNARTTAIALKLNISDTASMLTAYQASLNGKLNNDTGKFVNVTGAQNIPFYKSFTDTWANGQIRAGQTGQAGNITLYDGSTGAAQFFIRYTNATSTQANIISTSSAGLSLTNTGPSGNVLMGATGTTASSLQFQVGSSQTARNFLSGNWQFQDAGAFTDIPTAKVSINSTTKGFLPPRMTGAQMAAISSPATGLMVYNTDSVAFCYYNSSAWVKIGAATGGGSFDTTGQFNSYQNAINARLKVSDTSSMLTPYQNGLNARTAAIALKLNLSDTASMLGAYATGLNARTIAIALKVNISDTSSMLTAYRNGLNAKVNVSDTASMLTNYRNAINGKLNISDTAAMHTAYQVALNLRAPLASPALTGNPTAPTQTLTDSTTKLATTAFARQILQTAKNYADTGSTNIYIDTTTLAGGASSANPLKVKTGIQTLTDGATITFDCRKNYTATVTLGGNRTLSVTNIAAGTFITLKVVQDATGSRTLTLPSGSKVISGGAGAVTLTTTANAVDVLSALYDGTNYFWNIGKNYN